MPLARHLRGCSEEHCAIWEAFIGNCVGMATLTAAAQGETGIASRRVKWACPFFTRPVVVDQRLACNPQYGSPGRNHGEHVPLASP